MRSPWLAAAALAITLSLAAPAAGRIERIWLTHRASAPDKIVVNWETAEPGNSVVRFGPTPDYAHTVSVDESVTLHHVEIPLSDRTSVYHYSVSTGGDRSPDAAFKAYPGDVLRVAVVANWQGRPKLDAVVKDDVHLLLTAGDNIESLHRVCGPGVKDCTKPYSQLIDAYPGLFRTTPFMPALGNHDREIHPRGERPPPEAVYDVDATAFRRFFPLPGDGWKWHFDLPAFGLRFVALDLNHISDMGTTWQTCHPFGRESEQFRWYEKLMTGKGPPLVVTLYNERNASVRGREGRAWHRLITRGTAAVSGFGYFAERATVEGFPYYNTSLSGRGARYPDPESKFIQSEDSYVLITATAQPRRLKVELKSLRGHVLDLAEYEPRLDKQPPASSPGEKGRACGAGLHRIAEQTP